MLKYLVEQKQKAQNDKLFDRNKSYSDSNQFEEWRSQEHKNNVDDKTDDH